MVMLAAMLAFGADPQTEWATSTDARIAAEPTSDVGVARGLALSGTW